MELIDKAAVIAELEGYISNYKDIVAKTDRNDSTWVNFVSMIDAKIDVLQHLLSFLNTLEVKGIEVNLSKKDIIHLLRGVEIPDYKTLFELRNMGFGDYTGGFIDSFEWNNANSESWNKYSEEELYELYRKITK